MPEHWRREISKKPTVKAEPLLHRGGRGQLRLLPFLDKVVAEARYLDIRRIGEETAAAECGRWRPQPRPVMTEVILDIRSRGVST